MVHNHCTGCPHFDQQIKSCHHPYWQPGFALVDSKRDKFIWDDMCPLTFDNDHKADPHIAQVRSYHPNAQDVFRDRNGHICIVYTNKQLDELYATELHRKQRA